MATSPCGAAAAADATAAVATPAASLSEAAALIAFLQSQLESEHRGRVTAELALRAAVNRERFGGGGATPGGAIGGYPLFPIGFMASPFVQRRGAPRQGALAPDSRAALQLAPAVSLDAFDGLTAYSHVFVLFLFHENTNAASDAGDAAAAASGGGPRKGGAAADDPFAAAGRTFPTRIAAPGLFGKRVGVFATRSPHRPNALGLSLVRLVGVDAARRRILLGGCDLIAGTPVVDIKPACPYDCARCIGQLWGVGAAPGGGESSAVGTPAAAAFTDDDTFAGAAIATPSPSLNDGDGDADSPVPLDWLGGGEGADTPVVGNGAAATGGGHSHPLSTAFAYSCPEWVEGPLRALGAAGPSRPSGQPGPLQVFIRPSARASLRSAVLGGHCDFYGAWRGSGGSSRGGGKTGKAGRGRPPLPEPTRPHHAAAGVEPPSASSGGLGSVVDVTRAGGEGDGEGDGEVAALLRCLAQILRLDIRSVFRGRGKGATVCPSRPASHPAPPRAPVVLLGACPVPSAVAAGLGENGGGGEEQDAGTLEGGSIDGLLASSTEEHAPFSDGVLLSNEYGRTDAGVTAGVTPVAVILARARGAAAAAASSSSTLQQQRERLAADGVGVDGASGGLGGGVTPSSDGGNAGDGGGSQWYELCYDTLYIRFTVCDAGRQASSGDASEGGPLSYSLSSDAQQLTTGGDAAASKQRSAPIVVIESVVVRPLATGS